MSFQEIQFPTEISYGSRGGPGYNTAIVTTDSGFEYRTPKWSKAKRSYQVGYAIKSIEQLATIAEFYTALLGPAIGFRFKDWSDYSTATVTTRFAVPEDVSGVDEVIGTGNGSQTLFQLVKRYGVGSLTRSRTIEKPVEGSVKVALNSVEQLSGWTVDTTTGVVTFTVAPSNGVIVTAGFEFDVPVRFGEGVDDALSASIDGFDMGSVSDIPLMEILDVTPTADILPSRGSGEFTLSANKTVQLNEGSIQSFDPDSNLLELALPDPTNLEGGRYFTLVHAGSSHSIVIKDDQDATLLNITSGQATEIWLTQGNGQKFWIALA